jgi:stearoyl-CoA desaturase (delta-9 desaturase)
VAETSVNEFKAPGWGEKLLLLFIVILPLAGLVYAVVEFWNHWVTATDLTLLLVLYGVTTLGIGIGFHRMLTHKGFDAPAPVRFIFLALGSMALEGPAIDWAATHVKHHAKSDKEGDPHSPLEGFWHAHMGWLFSHGQKVEELYYRGFKDDKVAQFVSKTFWLWTILTFAIPFGIGYAVGGTFIHALSGLIWGGVIRVFFNHHVTWSVNSVCHTFGQQPFQTPDRSKNEWIVGLLALGEGWHNNHHAFPRSAVHGIRWYQFDLSAYIIRLMASMRLVRNVYTVKKAQWLEAMRTGKTKMGPVTPPAA